MGKENFTRQVEDNTKLSLETAGFQDVVSPYWLKIKSTFRLS